MKFEFHIGRRLFEVQLRQIQATRWEIQDCDEHGHLAWYSGEPFMTRSAAVDRARRRELPDGWTRRVRHVGSGEVAYAVTQHPTEQP